MEDLNGMWQRLSLSETEGDRFILEPSNKGDTHPLAAKFFTRRVINVEAVTRTFRPLWRSEKGFTARDMGENIILFEFEDEADLKRVLMSEPWSYDKSIVAFHRLLEDGDLDTMVFDNVVFWVQIHNLPILSLKREVALGLGKTIGEVLTTTDSDEEMGGGRVMRIRVKVNINKPLCRGRKIGLANGKDSWVAFRYERLPNYCYWCGLLTHGEKDCDYWLRNHADLRQEDQAYGPWLRATGSRPYRKVEIHVAGRAPRSSGTVKDSRGFTEEVVEPPAGKEAVNAPTRKEKIGAQNQGPATNTPDLGQSDTKSFEETLAEIDKEMGFLNENLNDLKVQESFPCQDDTALKDPTIHGSTDLSPCQDGRMPFKEISNSHTTSTPGKSTRVGVGSWKKKARAKKNGPEPIGVVLSEKRMCDSMHVDMELVERPGKLLRTTPLEDEAAAAGTQPRRDQ
jgi:hypothetical protein